MPTATLYLLHFNTYLVWEPAFVAGYVTSLQSSLKKTTELLPAPVTGMSLCFMGQFQPLWIPVLTAIPPLSGFCEGSDAIAFLTLA